jgi:succinylglutamate desuccinylase
MRIRIFCSVFLPALGLLALLAGPSGAADKDAKYFQQQFNRFSKVIADLKEADVTEGAASDIEMIRTWIGQAQAFLANDRIDDIEPIMKKIEAQAQYIRAKINRLAAESEAEEAEALASNAEELANKATKAADAAEEKMKALEAKGL